VPNFTAGTSFTDGVTNDVTAAKLNALVADAVPTSNLSLNSTTGTIATFNSTTGTIATLNSTTGTIATLNSTTPTFLGAITASTNTINVGSGQIVKDASGNVGIGTSSPVITFGKSLNLYNDANTGTVASNTFLLVESVNRNAVIELAGTSIATNFLNFSDVPGTAVAGVGSQVADQNLLFRTGGGTVRMCIDSSGNVGIGTSSPSAQLELSTDSAKKPSTNTWTIASDQRLKTNITNADNDRCYEIVKQVPLKRYTWKSEVYSQEKVKDRSKLGWIAQDVEAVFPKAVGTNRFAYNQVFEDVVTPELDSDGNTVLDENGVAKTKTEKRLVSEDVIEDCKDLNSDQIYAAMYGTIQKLIEKVESLEAKVAVLEAA
jgi:hypothetical protein